MTLKYIHYHLPNEQIQELLISKKYLNVFIDLNSIAKGFYVRDMVLQELNYYLDNKKISNVLINELQLFLGNMFYNFKNYFPRFIIFYDTGVTQNTICDSSYKANRLNVSKYYIINDDEKTLYYEIKDYYFNKIYSKFRIKNTVDTVFLKEYETDLIPYYVIKHELLNRSNDESINLVLSMDKDLLQCCSLTNTYQSICQYVKTERNFKIRLFDKFNALSYIHNFKPPILSSDYLSVLLSLSGDKSDNIKGIDGVGPVNALKLIKKYNMDVTINSNTTLPTELLPYKNILIKNFKMISFDEQILRLPVDVLRNVNDSLKQIFW